MLYHTFHFARAEKATWVLPLNDIDIEIVHVKQNIFKLSN